MEAVGKEGEEAVTKGMDQLPLRTRDLLQDLAPPSPGTPVTRHWPRWKSYCLTCLAGW